MGNNAALLARYFDGVLGVRRLAAEFFVANGVEVEDVEAAPAPAQTQVWLVDLDPAPTASLEKMREKILEAVLSEWMKYAARETLALAWRDGVHDGAPQSGRSKSIVFGPRESTASDLASIAVPSLREMQSSPMAKRNGWQLIQESVRLWAK